jgi:hypothetical protein
MRFVKINDTDLKSFYGNNYNSLWEALKDQFEEIFTNRSKHNEASPRERLIPDILFTGNKLTLVKEIVRSSTGWDWYVKERISPYLKDLVIERKLPENQLLEFLDQNKNKNTKQILLIHGDTGHGKTTFIINFFKNWLPRNNPELAEKLCVIRISISHTTSGNDLEDDFDHQVRFALNEIADFIYEDKHLLNIAKLDWSYDLEWQNKLLKKYPIGTSEKEKIDWVKSSIGRGSINDANNEWHDFNRLAINYLTNVLNWNFVFILDNIDQTPKDFQEKAFVLARHKLDWMTNSKNLYYILCVRSYLINKAEKECICAAWDDKHDIKIYPPPIDYVLNSRLKYFIAKLPKIVQVRPSEYIKHDKTNIELQVTKEAIVIIIQDCIRKFGDVNINLALSLLANYDVRQQLKMVRACLQSPRINWYKPFSLLTGSTTPYGINYYELFSGIMNQDNTLCPPNDQQFFKNIFSFDQGDHFSCTLNCYYILKLLSKGAQTIEEIVSTLCLLGHSKGKTMKTIQLLLLANIITSKDGIYIDEHKIKVIEIDHQNSTIGLVYLEILPFELRYLESMAYLTPLTKELKESLPIPYRNNMIMDFDNYILATSILLKQIEKDENDQINFAKTNGVYHLLEENELMPFVKKIKSSIIKTLSEMQEKKLYFPKVAWDDLIELFKI